MFSKKELVCAVVVSLIGGFAVGYSKARELCLQSIIIATGKQEEDKSIGQEES